MTMHEPLDHLAVDMFHTFARFEYSLKAAGFHYGNGPTQANWRKFAVQVAPLFDDPQDEAPKQAIDYILSHPPKKQVVANAVITGARLRTRQACALI